jgi:hypothetical protein
MANKNTLKKIIIISLKKKAWAAGFLRSNATTLSAQPAEEYLGAEGP